MTSARRRVGICLHVLALLLLSSVLHAADPVPAKPNILLIVSDDQGWDDIGYHNDELRTPHLDRLAKEGVELNQHYVQPQCTPTRVALMTGRYPSRFGDHCTQASNVQSYPYGTLTLASMLNEKGYATGMSGKWHMGSLPKWGPNHYGFDYSHGSLAGAVGMYDHRYRLNRQPYTTTWHRNEEFIDEVGHATDLTTGEAVKWIKQHTDEPWLFYVPFHAVHTPIVEGDPQWQAMNSHIEDTHRRFFAAAISHMDTAVGKMVAALRQSGQRERTLIIFTSDNGGIHNDYGGGHYPPPDPELSAGFSSNMPLRSGKTHVYEGGMRVPAFANWPGVLEPHRLDAPVHVVDWMPTLASLTGYEVEEDPGWDGRNIWPQLTGAVTAPEARTLYWVWGPTSRRREAIRHGDWKLLRDAPEAAWELYNLAEDPIEKNNLLDAHPEQVEKLLQLYEQQRQKDAS